MRKTLLAAILAGLVATPAMAADVVVFCPGAVQSVVRELVKSYEQKTGNTVKFEFGTAGAVAKRVAEGAQGDVVLATNTGLAKLATQGKVDGASIRDLGSMGVGVAVKAGAAEARHPRCRVIQEIDAGREVDHVCQPGQRRPERHSHRQGVRRDRPRQADRVRKCSCATADRTA